MPSLGPEGGVPQRGEDQATAADTTSVPTPGGGTGCWPFLSHARALQTSSPGKELVLPSHLIPAGF